MLISLICFGGFSVIVVSVTGFLFWKSCSAKKVSGEKKREECILQTSKPPHFYYEEITDRQSTIPNHMRRCDYCGHPCQMDEYPLHFPCNHVFHRRCILYKTSNQGFNVCNICITNIQ